MNLDALPLTFAIPPYFLGLGEYLGEKHKEIFDKSMLFNYLQLLLGSRCG